MRSGRGISVVVRFQPFKMEQETGEEVELPSLYGISSSLKNIEAELRPLLKEEEAIQRRQARRKRRRGGKRSG